MDKNVERIKVYNRGTVFVFKWIMINYSFNNERERKKGGQSTLDQFSALQKYGFTN